MSYQTNIDNIDIEKILAESKRTRLGLEGSGYNPPNTTYQTTVIESSVQKEYMPSTYVQKEYVPSTTYQTTTKEYVLPSSYQTSVVQKEYVPSTYTTSYQTGNYSPNTKVRESENVKRAGLNDVKVTTVVSGQQGSVDGRLAIIMLGAEIERLLELGRDVEYRYNQLNIEVVTLREQMSIKEREIIEFRSRGGDNAEYYKILEQKEKEILLLRNNVTDTIVSPETENLRKRLKNYDYEGQDLRTVYDKLSAEVNKIMSDLGKGRQARANANTKKSTAWCC